MGRPEGNGMVWQQRRTCSLVFPGIVQYLTHPCRHFVLLSWFCTVIGSDCNVYQFYWILEVNPKWSLEVHQNESRRQNKYPKHQHVRRTLYLHPFCFCFDRIPYEPSGRCCNLSRSYRPIFYLLRPDQPPLNLNCIYLLFLPRPYTLRSERSPLLDRTDSAFICFAQTSRHLIYV